MPTGKKQTLTLLLAALAFVFAGVLFILEPDMFTSTRRPSALLVQIGGAASVLFFGFCAFFLFRDLLRKQP